MTIGSQHWVFLIISSHTNFMCGFYHVDLVFLQEKGWFNKNTILMGLRLKHEITCWDDNWQFECHEYFKATEYIIHGLINKEAIISPIDTCKLSIIWTLTKWITKFGLFVKEWQRTNLVEKLIKNTTLQSGRFTPLFFL